MYALQIKNIQLDSSQEEPKKEVKEIEFEEVFKEDFAICRLDFCEEKTHRVLV